MTDIDLAAYARDGYLVLPGFLPAAECDALQARAAELVADFDPGPARVAFSTHDQGHARTRYFRESGGAIRFFFEEAATDQAPARALNKIGHALHDLDPVFDRISRRAEMAALPDWSNTLVVTHWGFILSLTGERALNAQVLRCDPNGDPPAEVTWHA